ncbi:MAG TPA: spore maturation protein, partial [Bacilli bacterium]|nr:spore maturation protein [Bacilli bacterium]
KELRRLNLDREEASRSMITLLAINTSGITLIPTTVIALRMNYDSLAPTEIVGTTLVASTIAVIAAVFIDRFYYYRHRARR